MWTKIAVRGSTSTLIRSTGTTDQLRHHPQSSSGGFRLLARQQQRRIQFNACTLCSPSSTPEYTPDMYSQHHAARLPLHFLLFYFSDIKYVSRLEVGRAKHRHGLREDRWYRSAGAIIVRNQTVILVPKYDCSDRGSCASEVDLIIFHNQEYDMLSGKLPVCKN